MTLARKD